MFECSHLTYGLLKLFLLNIQAVSEFEKKKEQGNRRRKKKGRNEIRHERMGRGKEEKERKKEGNKRFFLIYLQIIQIV